MSRSQYAGAGILPVNRASTTARQILLGRDGARRNEAYLIWYPMLLGVAALTGIAAPSPVATVAALCIASVVACASLVALCAARARLRISRVLGTGLLQGYALGALPTAMSSLISHDPVSVLYASDSKIYMLALCQVFLGVALLWLVGELTEPFLPIPDLSPSTLRYFRNFAWIAAAFVVLGLATGKTSYMGDSTQTDGHTGILTSLLGWCLGPAIGVTTALLATSKLREQRFLYGGLLVFLVLSTLPLGRRFFLYTLLLALILYSVWKPSFSRSGWKFAAAVLFSVFAISTAWTAFLYLRLATYTYSEGESVSLWDLSSRAWIVFTSKDQGDVLQQWTESGVEERVDVIDFNMELLEQTSIHSPAYGGNALNALTWVVPGVLWPDKKVMAEEAYASELFHTDYPDEANSIFTAATIDFGFWGGLFYPILVSWALTLLVRLCRRLYSTPMAYLCACVVLPWCLATESELQAYFIVMRDILLFATAFDLCLRSGPIFLRAAAPHRLQTRH